MSEPAVQTTAHTTGGTPRGAVTAARGFVAAGLHCGIRQRRPDLALLVCDRPATAAAVFTTNRFQAAPVILSREHLAASGGVARAVVINSGIANACTGVQGMAAARRTAAETAALLGVTPREVLVSSTGVIGQPLPLGPLLAGLRRAAAELSPAGGAAAAEAILTTDTRVKESLTRVGGRRTRYRIGGMAKGSGMIHPDLATTLAFVTTDAAVSPAGLHACLARATELTFNRISVDGDTSTNDMVAVLASGASGCAVDEGPARSEFLEALTAVLKDLAKQVAGDGEGASRRIAVEVTGARGEGEAVQVARTIAGSLLVKTAVHGADPNWGRIAAAAGRSGVEIDPDRLTVGIGSIDLFAHGAPLPFSEAQAKRQLERPEVVLRVDLGLGSAAATVWTCDLTDGYIRINASYRT